MSQPHKWTKREISTMEKLRSEGKSFRKIAERIGTVSKGQVQKKFRELHGHDGRRANPQDHPAAVD